MGESGNRPIFLDLKISLSMNCDADNDFDTELTC